VARTEQLKRIIVFFLPILALTYVLHWVWLFNLGEPAHIAEYVYLPKVGIWLVFSPLLSLYLFAALYGMWRCINADHTMEATKWLALSGPFLIIPLCAFFGVMEGAKLAACGNLLIGAGAAVGLFLHKSPYGLRIVTVATNLSWPVTAYIYVRVFLQFASEL
jgi:hypothetical protein